MKQVQITRRQARQAVAKDRKARERRLTLDTRENVNPVTGRHASRKEP